jgi:IS30 family transposase
MQTRTTYRQLQPEERMTIASMAWRVRACGPWPARSDDNTNGLPRQYLPKGTDLSAHTQAALDAIADSLNSRPRATHAFHSPLEVFAAMINATYHPSTFIH